MPNVIAGSFFRFHSAVQKSIRHAEPAEPNPQPWLRRITSIIKKMLLLNFLFTIIYKNFKLL